MNVARKLLAAALCCGVATVAIAQTGAPATLTNEQLRHFRSIRNPQLSPDGHSVVSVIVDSTAEGGKSHLWLIDTGGAEPRQLTYSPESDKSGEHDPRWMPDGESILFLAHRGEHTKLYRLPMRGGEAKAFDLKVHPAADTSRRFDAISVDELEPQDSEPTAESSAIKKIKRNEGKLEGDSAESVAVDVERYSVSPDGKSIALLINDPQTAGEKRQKEAKADAQWVDHDPHVTRLYLLNPVSGKLTQTAASPDVRSVAWSPDSTRLVVVSEEPNGVADLRPANSTALLSASMPNQLESLPALPSTIGAVEWSKDGQRLVYQAQAKQDAPPGVRDLYEYDLVTRSVVDRSAALLGSLTNEGPLTLHRGEIDQLVEVGVNVFLARFPVGKNTPEILHFPVATISSANTNQKENGWVFVGSDGTHLPALYFSADPLSEPRVLKLPMLSPAEGNSIGAKRVHWKSDQFNVDGLLYLPADAGKKKVPLVVEVHGGPTGVFSDRYDPFTQFLLSQGWAVLQPNPRGSTGYGAGFAAANKNDLGGGDFRDIMAGVDFVLKTESIDSACMALIGYSYGGEMAGFVGSRTNRFKAIVSAAPVIDQASEYGTEKSSLYDRWFYGYPWEHPADAWRQSPLAGIAHMKTPFLLIQGESDTVDPLGQSQEMYRALRQANVPVELVTYPREDHGPLANAIFGGSSTEPWHGFDARQRIIMFLMSNFNKVETTM